MTREEKKNALHCLKVMIGEEVCEECDLYGTTGTDHCEADCVRVAIKALEQEPCGDTISRQAVLDEAFEVDTKEYGRIEVVGVDAIDALPPVNSQPKTGHWIYIGNKVINHSVKIVECDKCHNRTYGSGKYCPNCGCHMFEPQESEE